jgi:hypothetical protein
LKKRSLVFSALAALSTAGVLAGCGSTYYFAGRTLPPSGIANRVLIAVQNPSIASKGLLTFVDAFYDIRHNYKDTIPSFSISGYSGALPATIQNMPEEQTAAVYGAGDGSLDMVNYAKETNIGPAATLNGLSSSVFISRARTFIIAASQQANVVTVVDQGGNKEYALSLPGVNHVAMNPGGTVMMAFVQNSNYAYYPRKLQSADSTSLAAYYASHASWPAPYVDCEPKALPGMCLAQVQDPSGTPLTFDRPVKAIFGADGSSMYILNCGPECGGTTASVTMLPAGPFNVNEGQQTGAVPTQSALTKYATPGGASNALETPGLGISSGSATAGSSDDMLYVLGQQYLQDDGLWAGRLTPIDLTTGGVGTAISVSDSAPGSRTKMIVADDNTLWLGGVRCAEGERYATGQPYGCLTMFNTTTNSVTTIEPFQGDLTGIAAVTTLHKVYIAEGGQVYIYKTTDGTAMNNFYVTVTGTAYDVAYMDGTSDANNTTY